MLTIAPPPDFAISRATAWPTRKAPLRLTPITASQSASPMSRKSAARKIPALLIRTSIRPKAASVAAVAASTSARLATSQRMERASAPSSAASAWPAPASPTPNTRLGPAPASTCQSASFAPLAANRRAQAAPMPLAAPVTTTTRPVKSKRVVAMGSGSGAIEPDADALGIELEVEREQLADAFVAQRDAVRAKALQVDGFETPLQRRVPVVRPGERAGQGDHLVELSEEEAGEPR